MNKQKIVIIIGVIVVIALVVIFGGQGSKPVAREDGSIEGEYSIKNIMDLGKPYECTFNKSDGASSVTGALRIHEGKVRGDFDIHLEALDGGSFASHLIINEGYSYNWTSIQPIGFKSKIVEKSASSDEEVDQAQIIGVGDKVAYKCVPWNADLTAFNLPPGIQFSELTPKQ